jgi:hypothetical protein
MTSIKETEVLLMEEIRDFLHRTLDVRDWDILSKEERLFYRGVRNLASYPHWRSAVMQSLLKRSR